MAGIGERWMWCDSKSGAMNFSVSFEDFRGLEGAENGRRCEKLVTPTLEKSFIREEGWGRRGWGRRRDDEDERGLRTGFWEKNGGSSSRGFVSDCGEQTSSFWSPGVLS